MTDGERLEDIVEAAVARGDAPGVVAAVARGDKTKVAAAGAMAIGGPPMRPDTMFRIASITKPVTAAVVLSLADEGVLGLDEPVDRLLPELADRRVLRRPDGPLDDVAPANRPISLRDLLTFRMGFGVVMAPPGTYPIQRAVSELLLFQGPPQPQMPPAPDEWIRRLGTLPLMHQPGERWLYHTGSDVLGVLVARASGQPFETFL